MAVANETIITKMKEELSRAEKWADNPEKMSKSISNIRLLCDLLLESGETSKSVQLDRNEISPEEMKAMIGKANAGKPSVNKSAIDHEEANGDSLFDF
ncbi:YwdI family protein [Virgibacillus sp. SK37]|uniref:YwdI family protein n=1 Tax=Virgibacillus sp. SK37 TaxID=403957 RepID=UPI0004D1A6E4|nr:YwdI family protein [Virgibacillus sp. SK37]AIF45612.1 hypothetical protein X953_17570 [Virgibacillus sp. SK37]